MPDGSQIVLSIEAFRAQLDKALSMKVRPLLIFDQFEELITLFEEARGEGRTERVRLNCESSACSSSCCFTRPCR